MKYTYMDQKENIFPCFPLKWPAEQNTETANKNSIGKKKSRCEVDWKGISSNSNLTFK